MPLETPPVARLPLGSLTARSPARANLVKTVHLLNLVFYPVFGARQVRSSLPLLTLLFHLFLLPAASASLCSLFIQGIPCCFQLAVLPCPRTKYGASLRQFLFPIPVF
jgi:hypothetical protein